MSSIDKINVGGVDFDIASSPTLYRQTATSFNVVGTSEGSALAHTIYGMSVQDGTPTPSVPVEIQSAEANFKCVGKNLIPYPYRQERTNGNPILINGVTWTSNADRTVSAVGTASGNNSNYYLTDWRDETPLFRGGETYTLTGCPSGGDTTTYCLIFYGFLPNQSGSELTPAFHRFDTGNGVTFTIPQDCYGRIYCRVANGFTAPTNAFKPMLTLVGADQTYEPYQHTDVTTDLTLRSIEVASTDDYTYERDGKYYIADTIDWSEDRGYEITRRVASSTISELTGFIKTTNWQGKQAFTYRDDTTKRTPSNHKSFALSSGYEPQIRDAYISGTASDYGIFTTPTGGIVFTMPLNSYSSKDDFLADQGNQNVQYVLITPTTEPITSEQAQALLSLKTYDEATSISATGDIEPSLDLEYSKDRNTALALTGHNEAYIAQELECLYGVKNLIPYPYYQTSQTVLGVTTTDNGDGTLTFNGTTTVSSVIFRITNNNQVVKIPLNKAKYLLTWVEREKHQKLFRVDIGMLKTDGTTQVINGEQGETIIDNTDGKYIGIFAVSVYSVNNITVNNLTFKPMLRLASIQSDEYQPYAMSNHELTVLVKQLQTALNELGGN